VSYSRGMKKTLTKASSTKSKKKSSKEELPTFPLRRPRLSSSPKDRGSTKPIKYITKRNGQLETEEERKKRIAKREALFLKAWQMTYDAHHKQ
jgi:hypothetical protein